LHSWRIGGCSSSTGSGTRRGDLHPGGETVGELREDGQKRGRKSALLQAVRLRVRSALRLLLGLLAARRERGCASVAEELPEELRQLVKCCGMPENACVTSSLHRTSVSVGGGAAPGSTPVAAVIGVYMVVAAAVPASSWSIVCHPRAQYHQEPSSI